MFSSMPINGNFNVSRPQILGQPNSTSAIQMLMLQMMMSMATILASMMNQQGSVMPGGAPNFGGSSGSGSPGLNGFLGGSAQPGNTSSQRAANPQSATASSGKPSGNLVDLGGGKKVDASIAGNVKAMIEAAKRDGVDLKITSAHRSREQQEVLYQKYKDQGLVVLGFPCNQFGNQEPGNADDIQEFCQVNYGVSFPIFAKIDVNGSDAHPIFKYLKSELSGLLGGKIKWNFTKFVIDKTGKPVKRFAPTTEPSGMDSYIERIL